MKIGEVSTEFSIYRTICGSLEPLIFLPKLDPTCVHTPSRTRVAYHRFREPSLEWFS
jgi:hypothetical protein